MPCAQVVEKQCILYQLIFIKDMVCLFESVENGVRFFYKADNDGNIRVFEKDSAIYLKSI